MRKLLTTSALMFVAACSGVQKPDRMLVEQKSFSDLNGFETAANPNAMEAFNRACEKFKKMPASKQLHFPAGHVSDWMPACNELTNLRNRGATQGEYHQFLQNHFTPYLVTNNGKKQGLFTGYFAPELRGSRVKTDQYPHAIYKKPKNFKKPYLSREEIDNGALIGKGLELVYVNDPVELFFLHIQGSGRVRMEDGSVMRVGYAAQNGHKYYAIGRELVKQDVMKQKDVTAPSIKQWLRDNSCHMQTVFNYNPSYIFFRELKGEDKGPIGAMGVPIVDGHTLAVDDEYISYGIPLWLETTLPNGSEFNRLMVALDTGGAIKGPVRGDVYVGSGHEAGVTAGNMKQKGSYYMLLPKHIKPIQREEATTSS